MAESKDFHGRHIAYAIFSCSFLILAAIFVVTTQTYAHGPGAASVFHTLAGAAAAARGRQAGSDPAAAQPPEQAAALAVAPYELPAATACVTRPQPPTRRGKLAEQELLLAYHIGWWTGYLGDAWEEPDCSLEGRPLRCQFLPAFRDIVNATVRELLPKATAVVHSHHFNASKNVANAPTIMFSMESSWTFSAMDTMRADIEMSYRTCAQVWSPYWSLPLLETGYKLPSAAAANLDALRQAPVPLAQKRHAVMYVNSNCFAQNLRPIVVGNLEKLLKAANSSLAIHGYGRCGNNMDAATMKDFRNGPKQLQKIKYLRRYKFCIAMENNITPDYVTEKLYQALVAGCVPIYWGAHNIADYIPTMDAIIDYSRLGSPEALKYELERLVKDEDAYSAKLAWKTWPVERYNPGFRRLHEYSSARPMCHLCRYIASHDSVDELRNKPKCGANEAWASAYQPHHTVRRTPGGFVPRT